MNHSDILGLMSPIIALIFSLTFFALWLQQRSFVHLGAFAGAFFMCSAGVTISHFVIKEFTLLNVIISCTLYSIGVATFFWAHCKRMEHPSPIKPMAAVAALCTLVAFLITANTSDVFTNFYTVMITIGVQFSIGSWWIKTKVPCTNENQGLFWTCILITALLFLSPPVVYLIEGSINEGSFQDSLQWTMTVTYVGLCVVFLSIYLIFGHSKDLLNRIKEASQVDFLTGLKTRQGYEEGMRDMFSSYETEAIPVSIIIADIDNFKRVNDEYGHVVGDNVIKAFGNLFNQVASENDIAGRVGGEEISLILWNTNKEMALLAAQQLCSQFSITAIDGLPLEKKLTASFGVATTLMTAEDKLHLYGKADKALYSAKNNGKNQVCFANNESSIQKPMLKSA